MYKRHDLIREFHENLRTARLRKGISTKAIQEIASDLAKITGVQDFAIERSSVTRYETTSWPTVPKLITLAKAYGVTVEELLAPLLDCPETRQLNDSNQIEERDPLANPEHRRYHTLLEFILEHGRRDKEIAGIAAQLEAAFELLCRRGKKEPSSSDPHHR